MPGHEVADRAVRAHAQAHAGERRLEVVAEPAQDLELEVVVAGDRDRVRERAHVVARRSRRGRCGRAAISRRVSRSKLRSLSTLASNTGGGQPCWRASTVSCSQ